MKIPSRLDVFLSSSQKEFEDIRKSLEKEISALPFLSCRLLEKRGAKPIDTTQASLQASRSCDIYIGLFGRVYSETTIKEYKEADKKFKPILVYVKKLEKRDAKLQKSSFPRPIVSSAEKPHCG